MEKKITMNHHDKKIEYILYDTLPCKPFLNINGFYLRLSQIPSGDIKINGLYPYMQRNSIYVTDENGLLKKIATENGMEEWNCNVEKNINSVFSQNTNVFLGNRENIREMDDNKQLLKTLNIQSDKVIADKNDFCIAKANKLSKITGSGQEQFSYDLDSNIKDIALDKIGNIYVATDKDVRKLRGDIIEDKINNNILSQNIYTDKFGSDTGIQNWKVESNSKNRYIKITSINDSERENIYKWLQGLILENIKLGEYYTISFYSKTNCNNLSFLFHISYDNIHFEKISITPSDEWKKYSITVEKTNNVKSILMEICADNIKSNQFAEFKDFKLEKGKIATDYTINESEYANIGEWKYSINSNSIALDSENNIYISTNSNIEKLNSKGQKIDTLDIQADNIALDIEDNMYISKDKSVEKLSKGKSEWKYIDNSKITNICVG